MNLFFTSLSLTLALALGNDVATQSEHRELQGLTPLEQIFRVDNPTLVYDTTTNEFTLTTLFGWGENGVGDGPVTAKTSGAALEVYDTCPNGDHDYQGATFQGEETEPFFFMSRPDPNWMVDLTLDAENAGPTTIVDDFAVTEYTSEATFTINGNIQNYAGYTEVGNTGTLVFCVRFGLTAGEGGAGDVDERRLVNFRQMEVTVVYDLLAGFDEIDSFTTQAIEEVLGNAEDSFSTTAGACDPDRVTPYNQGEEICISICPDAADDPTGIMSTSSIDSLMLGINNDPNVADQVVVFEGAAIGGVVSAIDCATDACCQVTFLLNGDFFAVGLSDAIQTATVTGSGSAVLTATANGDPNPIRKLAGIAINDNKARALQDDVKAPYEANFDVTQGTYDAESDASSIRTLMNAAAVVGAAGAVAML